MNPCNRFSKPGTRKSGMDERCSNPGIAPNFPESKNSELGNENRWRKFDAK